MFSIDATSNEKYYIILEDGKELLKISKANNTLDAIKKQYKIDEVKGGGNNETTSIKSI